MDGPAWLAALPAAAVGATLLAKRRDTRLAAAIETHVKSLDAIHLATAAMLPAPVTIVTRDRRMRDAARTLNLACSDAL